MSFWLTSRFYVSVRLFRRELRTATATRTAKKQQVYRLAKQQLCCTFSTHFCTFLCRHCTTTTRNFPSFTFLEVVDTRQRLSFSFLEFRCSPLELNSIKFSQHLTNSTRWNKRDKVWSSTNSLAHEPQVCHFFTTFWRLLWSTCLLLNRLTATWNLVFVLYSYQIFCSDQTDTHTCLMPLDCSRICASLITASFKSQTGYFLCLLLHFLFIFLVFSFFAKLVI